MQDFARLFVWFWQKVRWMRSRVALLVALLAVSFDQGVLRVPSCQAAGFHGLLWNITCFEAVFFWDFYSGGGLSPLTLLSYNLL